MKLMVLDGNSVINRAYYGVRALTTRDGFFTNAIYGFLNILEKLRDIRNISFLSGIPGIIMRTSTPRCAAIIIASTRSSPGMRYGVQNQAYSVACESRSMKSLVLVESALKGESQ